MAAISGFTYTVQKKRKLAGNPPVYENKVKLQFGDGSATYPTGGIPVAKASMGMPNNLESMVFVDAGSADGYVYKFDITNSKILMYEQDAGGPLAEISSSDTPQGTLYLLAKGY